MKSTFLRLFFLTVCATSLHAQNFSLQFDGDDDHAVFPECTAMTAPSFTIEGWFKCTPNFEPQTILMSFLDIPDKNANVTLEVRQNGLVRFNFRSVATVLGGEELSSTTAVADNVWHHFAVVKEGDTRLWLYIDGFPEVVTCGFYEPVSETPIFELAGIGMTLLPITDFFEETWTTSKSGSVQKIAVRFLRTIRTKVQAWSRVCLATTSLI
jgi:hypothetical protein